MLTSLGIHGHHDPRRAVDDGAASGLSSRRCFVPVTYVRPPPHREHNTGWRSAGTSLPTTLFGAKAFRVGGENGQTMGTAGCQSRRENRQGGKRGWLAGWGGSSIGGRSGQVNESRTSPAGPPRPADKLWAKQANLSRASPRRPNKWRALSMSRVLRQGSTYANIPRNNP
jgi:hypothetical protein